ncbi:MAG: ABC transporter permease [Chloroflexota bacterium]|nr:ABC transporter permease [Chloroflexota bacterium]
MTKDQPAVRIAKFKRPEQDGFTPSLNLYQKAFRRIRSDRPTLLAMAVLGLFVLLAVSAPFLSETVFQVDQVTQSVRNKYQPLFSPGHLLGTDELGRDHLSRLLYGGRISLGIGIAAAFLSLGIGIVVGVFAGFYGGFADDFIIWFITTLNSIPGLYFLILITALLKPTAATLVLVLGILGWTGITRLVRAETYSIKEREYIIAARAIGASNWRIMFIHIVPNIFSLLIITLSQAIGGLILTESALSFLGFGVQPPTPTWGNMLSGGLEYARKAPHLVYLPGLLITTTVFCLYLIGDGLRDAFDPKIAD